MTSSQTNNQADPYQGYEDQRPDPAAIKAAFPDVPSAYETGLGGAGSINNGPTPEPDRLAASSAEEERKEPLLNFEVITADKLRDLLPEPPPPRIAGVLPGRGGAVLIAQAGAGKTTMLANLARDLLEGTPFLGERPVRQVGGRIALLSYEMDAAELIDWCHSAGVDLTRLVVLDLRDVPNPLRDPFEREVLAKALDALEVEIIMVDTFGRAFTGDSQDSASDVTPWFAMLNEFTRTKVRAKEWIVAAHAGWTDGRGRGSSALHDAPDAVLIYKRDRDTETRTLRVDKYRGRDPMPEVAVTMDQDTLRLSSEAATPRSQTYAAAVTSYVGENPGCSIRSVRTNVRGHEKSVGDALDSLVRLGVIARTKGPRNAWLHTLIT
ncbi:AAA family ATPase [Nocardioides sp. NPDC023903]|uniref:AAA family ATPase n=1 Tax=Nocardioides sp. NPDC023903 TaxID=3157195 RepID=UPI003405766F